jgi:hypothetical protein
LRISVACLFLASPLAFWFVKVEDRLRLLSNRRGFPIPLFTYSNEYKKLKEMLPLVFANLKKTSDAEMPEQTSGMDEGNGAAARRTDAAAGLRIRSSLVDAIGVEAIRFRRLRVRRGLPDPLSLWRSRRRSYSFEPWPI